MKTVPQLAAELGLSRNTINVRIRKLWPKVEELQELTT